MHLKLGHYEWMKRGFLQKNREYDPRYDEREWNEKKDEHDMKE